MITQHVPSRIAPSARSGACLCATAGVIGLALSLAAPAFATLPVPAPDVIEPATPYYLDPCTDQNGDGVEDYLLRITDRDCDLYAIFDAVGWNPAVREAQVRAILLAHPLTLITIDYTSSGSPYIFLGNVDFGDPRAIPLELQEILQLPGIVGIRAYQRFLLTQMTSGTPVEPRPKDDVILEVLGPDGRPLPPGGATLPGGVGDGLSGRNAAAPVAPLPVVPSTLIYFVDSGIDGGGAYWGIDAPVDDPLWPQRGTDPKDLSTQKHGTFMKEAALQTALGELPGVPASSVRFADVRVAVGPNGETTTLELTRAFDAILAHIKYEAGRGITPRVVINVSYDTDGGIANHDIIYPKAEGRISPLGRAAGSELAGAGGAPSDAPRSAGRAAALSTPPDPCAIELFDNVYRSLNTTHGATIVVGAGNDGLRASYVINPMGRSFFATIVAAAIEPRTGQPASYSCFGTAPGGIGQNGHPDLAAVGTLPVQGFKYQLQGTSVATAVVSGVAAATLVKKPTLSPAALLTDLISKGSAIPSVGDHWYGDARVKTRRDHISGVPAPTDSAGAPTPHPVLLAGADRVAFEHPAGGAVTVRVFNVAGRLVRTLHDGPMAAGRHEFQFAGQDDAGAPLAGGLYFVRASGPGGAQVAKLLLRR